MSGKEAVHVLGISGGKDSAALANYMHDRIPDMQYFFCDTGEVLPQNIKKDYPSPRNAGPPSPIGWERGRG
jgi:NH3-dependent NAD+ synthetase